MQQNLLTSVPSLDAAALRQRLQASPGLVLVEALPASYYTSGHLAGAINVPHDAADSAVLQLLPKRMAETVVYCASATCPNSHLLAERLVTLGYTRVAVFTDGKAGWLASGGTFQR